MDSLPDRPARRQFDRGCVSDRPDRRIRSMTPAEKASLLKRWALEVGFQRAGVARLERSAHGRHLREWLARGDHAGMAYMARRVETRLAPARLLEGARSALCVALQYYPLGGDEEPREPPWSGVARYARGRDYHDVIEKRLRELGRRVEEAFPGSRHRPYVDTGPILERELAARAGLGAIGKNTQLLHPEGGSWFLLGELLLTLDLEPDPPVADLCGSCTRCLEACPTGALPEAYRLDSRRCISYWTIEHRGPVPEAVRPLLGEWVFGCDVCQEVCPWNAEVAPADEPLLRLPAARRGLDLAGLLRLRRDDYVERFRGSPMKRAKRSGLQRNAALAMGNRPRPAQVAALAAALEAESDPLVRGHAAWALGRHGATAVLRDRLGRERDPSVRREIAAALGPAAAADGAVSPT